MTSRKNRLQNKAQESRSLWVAAGSILGLSAIVMAVFQIHNNLSPILVNFTIFCFSRADKAKEQGTLSISDQALSDEAPIEQERKKRIAEYSREKWWVPEDRLLLKKRFPLRLSPESEKTKQKADTSTTINIYNLESLLNQGRVITLLGPPGAGKTDLLGELTGVLADRVSQNQTGALTPVSLSLTSWAKDPLPLNQWITHNLANKPYNLSEQDAKILLGKKDVILLLDGLDEVPTSLWEECTKQINEYRENYNKGIIVSCETQKWEELKNEISKKPVDILKADDLKPSRAFLDRAFIVHILPLPLSQVQIFLNQREKYKGLRQAVQGMPVLASTLNSPFVLEAATTVFAGKTAKNISDKLLLQTSKEECLSCLFELYVETMLYPVCYKRKNGSVKRAQVNDLWEQEDKRNQWLAWIATVTRAQNKSVFYTDSSQLDWLPQKTRRRILTTHLTITFLICGLPVILLMMTMGEMCRDIIAGFVPDTASQAFRKDSVLQIHEDMTWYSLLVWVAGDRPSSLLLGATTGAVSAIAFGSYQDIRQQAWALNWKSIFKNNRLLASLLTGSTLGLLAGATFTALLILVTTQRIGFPTNIHLMLVSSLVPWTLFGLVGGFIAGIINIAVRNLERTDTFTSSAERHILNGSLRNGLIVFFILLFISGFTGFLFHVLHDSSKGLLKNLWAGFVLLLPLNLVLAWCHGVGTWVWNRLYLLFADTRILPFPNETLTFLNDAASRGLLRHPCGSCSFSDLDAFNCIEAQEKKSSNHICGGYRFSHPHFQNILPQYMKSKKRLIPVSDSTVHIIVGVFISFIIAIAIFFHISPYDDYLAIAVSHQETKNHLRKKDCGKAKNSAQKTLDIAEPVSPFSHNDRSSLQEIQEKTTDCQKNNQELKTGTEKSFEDFNHDKQPISNAARKIR